MTDRMQGGADKPPFRCYPWLSHRQGDHRNHFTRTRTAPRNHWARALAFTARHRRGGRTVCFTWGILARRPPSHVLLQSPLQCAADLDKIEWSSCARKLALSRHGPPHPAPPAPPSSTFLSPASPAGRAPSGAFQSPVSPILSPLQLSAQHQES